MDAILFDLDGTLFDGTESIVESFQNAFKELNHPVPDSGAISSLIGYPLEAMLLELNAPKKDIQNFIAGYKRHYLKVYLEKTALLPHVKECVTLASTLAPLGVVTTKTSDRSKELLEHLNILHFFDVVIGRDDVVHPKPNKEPIVKALELLHVTPSVNSYMVGDTVLDMQAALHAGVTPVGVTCGYGREKDLKKHSSLVFDNSYQAVVTIKDNLTKK